MGRLNPILQAWLKDEMGPPLQDMRQEAELSQAEVSHRAGWHQSKTSKLENGTQMPSTEDIEAWCRACDAPARLDDLLALRRRADKVKADATTIRRPTRRRRLDELPHTSQVIRDFQVALVPDLLQTPDYARCVLETLGHESIDVAVADRMQRQPVLYASTKRFELLLAEPALRWRIAPPAVMRAQLDRLTAIVGMTNVQLGILPLDAELDTVPATSFRLYDDEVAVVDPAISPVAEMPASSTARYIEAMDALWRSAIRDAEARDLILEAAAALPRD